MGRVITTNIKAGVLAIVVLNGFSIADAITVSGLMTTPFFLMGMLIIIVAYPIPSVPYWFHYINPIARLMQSIVP
jgi:uncharacterized membrane protein